ncbi:MAG: flagellar motor switch protein FliM [Calditrichaeota bacterium]|nr:flagellar motor switch protein FliM [Calditrichota bacterium]
MSKILTQEEIDSLLRNVASGDSIEAAPGAGEKPIHLYDFKHPDRISKDQLRALRTIHDSFACAFGTYLSGTLRTLVDINLLSIDQAAYSEYMLSLSVPSCLYIISSNQLKGSIILEVSPQFSLLVVDRLLGGLGSRQEIMREMTIIEQTILRRVIESGLASLSDAWRSVQPMSLYVESYEANPQFVQIAPASESAVVISCEIVVRDFTYPMNLCFPYFVLEPMMTNLTTGWTNMSTKQIRPEEKNELVERVRLSKLPVRAQLGSTMLNMYDYLSLKIGDVLLLDQRTDDPVKVWVDKKVKFWAEPGNAKHQQAIRITRVISDQEEIVHE